MTEPGPAPDEGGRARRVDRSRRTRRRPPRGAVPATTLRSSTCVRHRPPLVQPAPARTGSCDSSRRSTSALGHSAVPTQPVPPLAHPPARAPQRPDRRPSQHHRPRARREDTPVPDTPVPDTPTVRRARSVQRRTPRPATRAPGGDPGASGSDQVAATSIERERVVVRAFLPLAVVLVVTACAVTAALLGSIGAARSAATALACGRGRAHGAASSDELWSGVLGLVAGGVGEEVVTQDEVLTLVGAARSDPPGPVLAGSGVGDAVRDATTSHARFLDAVGRSLEADGADPLELGNGLSDLSDAHRRAAEDSEVLVAALDTRADHDRPRHAGSRRSPWCSRCWALLLPSSQVVAARRRVAGPGRRPAGLDRDRRWTGSRRATSARAAGSATAPARPRSRRRWTATSIV